MTPHDLKRYERVLERCIMLTRIDEGELLPFVQLTMPTADDPDDVNRSLYDAQLFHRAMAAALEEVVFGRTRRLIISMPPRHGKTELASKRLVPFYLGHNPGHSIIFGTYNDKFSQDIGRAVRDIIQHPGTRQAFPDLVLKNDSQASDRLETTLGGVIAFVGRGGTTTGRGADCFIAGTPILTPSGEVPIETLATGATPHYVISYDIQNKRFRPQRVEAVQARPGVGLRRVTLASGRVVTATGDHRFLVDGRWTAARALAPGDRLVRAVRRGDDQGRARDQQTRGARPYRVLLFRRMLEFAAEHQKAWCSAVPGLRRKVTQRGAAVLARVCGGRPTAAACGDAGSVSGPDLLGMQYAVRDRARGAGAGDLLLGGMRRPGAFPAYVPGRQPEVEGRRQHHPPTTPFEEVVSGDASSRSQSGRARLRRLFGQATRAARSASSGQLAGEQRGVEPRDALLSVSSEMAFGLGWEAETDTVALVEQLHEPAIVYDLQVANDHNFVAAGVVAHNCFIIDDPFKDSAEADSPTFREAAWTWFNRVASTRLMTDKGAIVIIGTRWHPDDIIGRLTDPSSDFYDEREAREWKIIDLPAIAREDDILGRKEGQALWPSRFGVPFLRSIERRDPRGFSALYQGRPNPEGGTFFEDKWLKTYQPNELPKNLRRYCSSDHAVSLVRGADKTCLLAVGVDEDDTLWVLDAIWRNMNAEHTVDAMLKMIREHRPLYWWAERSHISKSIGPFLRKRMLETQTYATIIEVQPISDKQTRAQSIQGRMSMGKVRWPQRAPWWPAARDELLRFPHDKHDDLVDAIAYIGLGLTMQTASPTFAPRTTLKPGTFGWLKDQRARAERAARTANNGGW
jgi:predicted phage terminase large subunit-like protein